MQNQAQLLDRENDILTSPMNFDRHSPSPATTRIVAVRPFYRSRVTPDPYDYSNNSRRQADDQQYHQNQPQRRFSAHQINGKSKANVIR